MRRLILGTHGCSCDQPHERPIQLVMGAALLAVGVENVPAPVRIR